MKALGFTLVLWLAHSTPAVAQQETTEEATIRKASFVVSAWSCAATGKGTKAENERIFNAGLKAGREVLQFMKTATEAQQKTIIRNAPMLWRFAEGPNDDFRLGRLYSAVEDNQMENEVMRRNTDPKWHETKQTGGSLAKSTCGARRTVNTLRTRM
jgi:hypothetical protein